MLLRMTRLSRVARVELVEEEQPGERDVLVKGIPAVAQSVST
jgi:hypothetical protein